ncbi:MAG TPA: carbamoyl-phosphate synthase domain-containing protein, partial [Reyranella sp.]
MPSDLKPGELLPGVTGLLVLADGTVLQGLGCGAIGDAVGEVCFNTAMTGYQEILTDPSYMAQIVAFTFPHIGNVGANAEDLEQHSGGAETAARGAVFRDAPTEEANWRANSNLDGWMKRRGVIGLSGVDTRALTKAIREKGMPHGVIAHRPDGKFDVAALLAKAKGWSGLEGLDLAKDASCLQPFVWRDGLWDWANGYAAAPETPRYEVVVVDYGVKRN